MSSRPLAALATVALMGMSLLLLLPDCASACSCMVVSIQRYISSSDAVFSGEVVDLQKGTSASRMFGPSDTVTLRVSEAWKGTDQGTLEVSTPSQGSACGYHFEEGQEYLVYAYGKQDLKVDACGGTTHLSKADEDLALLGNGEKPTDGGDDLTDTSGGVSVRAMVGIAGLAMVASFLVVVRLVRTG
jgi:Tissue inhibitor of metalloproteinase